MTRLDAPDTPEAPAPHLMHRLAEHAAMRPDHVALRFLRRGEHVEEEVTYAALHTEVRILAANLAAAGLTGRPVVIALPQGLDFVRVFLGCLHAGAIAVPVPALGDPRGAERLAGIVADARPAALVAAPERRASPHWAALAERTPDLAFLTAAELATGTPGRQPADAANEEIAFLQYTSGSTSRPKGVVVTRANLAADLAMIETGFGQDADNSAVSWLPLHHDMGLIGCVLEPLSLGATTTLMAPFSFLQRPLRWLRAMDRFGATTAGAPNFAYDLCVRTIDAEAAATLDLSRWRLAFCGSEPVRAATLTRFAAHFAVAGFSARAFYPCYGLAEATLFVTGGAPGSGLVTQDLARENGAPMPVVSCGYPRRGTAVAILEPDSARPVAGEAIGEIAVSGDQVSPGFWADGAIVPDRAREVVLDGRRYLRTGDLGTVREGALYVFGRSKSMIIVRGQNIYAEDVEQTVTAHPAADAFGAVAALALLPEHTAEAGDSEGFSIVLELAHRGPPLADDALAMLRGAIAEAHGLLPRDLFVVPAGAIVRTVSGKLQRDATRARLEKGTMPVLRHHAPDRVAKASADKEAIV